jgi:hypothetical protein
VRSGSSRNDPAVDHLFKQLRLFESFESGSWCLIGICGCNTGDWRGSTCLLWLIPRADREQSIDSQLIRLRDCEIARLRDCEIARLRDCGRTSCVSLGVWIVGKFSWPLVLPPNAMFLIEPIDLISVAFPPLAQSMKQRSQQGRPCRPQLYISKRRKGDMEVGPQGE